MNKFHQIPTDKFVPISHDNSYLFTHYDKVANFLAFILEKNYKNILAKPVQNGYMFDWFSVHENLKNINEKGSNETEIGLSKYWEFIDIINAKILKLSNSNDEDNKNWANLLTKVFNKQDNFVFSNGNDICIVWGWKFDNNENYKPNFVAKSDPISPIEESFESQPSPILQDFLEEEYVEEPVDEEEIQKDNLEEENQQDNLEEEIIEKSSFLEFLKWFASNYWWLLLILIGLILITFFVKFIIYSN
jgi:hypothetical protein